MNLTPPSPNSRRSQQTLPSFFVVILTLEETYAVEAILLQWTVNTLQPVRNC